MEASSPPPVLVPESRRSSPWIVVPIAAGVLVVAAVLFLFDPARHGFYPRCVIHEWTGLYCPGCGSLRAAHELLHGRFASALGSNALLVLWGPVVAWETARQLAWETAGRRWIGFRHSGWPWAFLASAVLFTVLRNLPAARMLRPPS